MTTSVQNPVIKQGGGQIGNADFQMACSSVQEDRMCLHDWNHAGAEVSNGFLKHTCVSLPKRCQYDVQQLTLPQFDRCRMSTALLNGSCLGCSEQGLYAMQRLVVNNVVDEHLSPKQVFETWHAEEIPLDAQEYHSFVKDMKKEAQLCSVKHQELKLFKRHNETLSADAARTCLDTSSDFRRDVSSQIQRVEARVSNSVSDSVSNIPLHTCMDDIRQSHPLRETPGGGHSFDAVTEEVSEPLVLPFVFSRTSRQRSLYRRRALKKVDIVNFDAEEGDACASSLETKCPTLLPTLPLASHDLGPIVESPDWLPSGWLTEMKTRASGSSAGCKYKCYVDPVTKRRFRTRKEVFCFLRTGNTGRYKPKAKVAQSGEQSKSDVDCPATKFQSILQGSTFTGGILRNGSNFVPRSWYYRTGRSAYGGVVDIQAAALKLLTDDDDMPLEEKARLFARFSPRPVGLYGVRIPAKNFKRMKGQGKEGLEALGKVICQQGLSILRNCNNKQWQENV